MFVVLPISGYAEEDAQWYTNLEDAYDSALDWSAQEGGVSITIYEYYMGEYNKITEVFA